MMHTPAIARPAVPGQRRAAVAPTAGGGRPGPVHASAGAVPLGPASSTGLPGPLRAGMERLSGIALDDVRVYRNSFKPARLRAHAFAQGNAIHLGPGQDRHLPHEAWHVVQQKQGRVRATAQLAGWGVNADNALEREADVMGARGLAAGWIAGGARPRRVAGAGGVAQCYTVSGGVKTSQTGLFKTAENSEVGVTPGQTVERSHDSGQAYPGPAGYQKWVPDFAVIGDCIAGTEEITHGKKLKYGAPGALEFRDRGTKFGTSDARNRAYGQATDMDHDADPAVGHAFVIARQGEGTDESLPQFHGAAVVAQDGDDRITLETSAPLSGAVGRRRVNPIYDMYSSGKRKKKQSFKATYADMYGDDATVSVLKPSKKLLPGSEHDGASAKVVDYQPAKKPRK